MILYNSGKIFIDLINMAYCAWSVFLFMWWNNLRYSRRVPFHISRGNNKTAINETKLLCQIVVTLSNLKGNFVFWISYFKKIRSYIPSCLCYIGICSCSCMRSCICVIHILIYVHVQFPLMYMSHSCWHLYLCSSLCSFMSRSCCHICPCSSLRSCICHIHVDI